MVKMSTIVDSALIGISCLVSRPRGIPAGVGTRLPENRLLSGRILPSIDLRGRPETSCKQDTTSPGVADHGGPSDTTEIPGSSASGNAALSPRGKRERERRSQVVSLNRCHGCVHGDCVGRVRGERIREVIEKDFASSVTISRVHRYPTTHRRNDG